MGMRARWFAVVFALLVGVGAGVGFHWQPTVQAQQLSFVGCPTGTEDVASMNEAYEQEVVERVNALRASLNPPLPPLKRQSDLGRAARYHAHDMVQDNYPPDPRPNGHSPHNSHDRQGDTLTQVCTFSERLENFYTDGQTYGENLAYGYRTPEQVMNGWIKSSGHYKNMTSSSYWEIGTGYATASGTDWTHYWSQNFGRRKNVYPVVINGEAATTPSTEVTLYIYGTGTFTEMRLRNDDGAWSDWRPFAATMGWTLPNISGERTVHVELRSNSKTASASDTITLVGGGEVTPLATATPSATPTSPPTATPTITPTPQPQPTLHLSNGSGAPGSTFSLHASNFPANTLVVLRVNSVQMMVGTTDADGALTLLLDTNAADAGLYLVELQTGDGQISRRTSFTLASDLPTRTPEPGATGETVAVPAGLAQDLPNVYLPLIRRAALGTPTATPRRTTSVPATATATATGVPATATATTQAGDGTLNMQDRQSVLNFYNAEYSAPVPAYGWNGNVASCNAGDTSAEFKAAMLRRVNFYRAMAGIDATVTFVDEYNRKAQQAALMMSANDQLSHEPPTSWTCYTADGAEAAGSSNLHWSTSSSSIRAIDSYIKDSGSGNYFVGHRRWILYPPSRTMGTGDVPAGGGFAAANALWVFGDRSGSQKMRNSFVAWPPPGFVPYQIVYPRWSFSLHGANFSSATVTMQSSGQTVALEQAAIANGYGDNTLVWIPLGLSDRASWPRPDADTTYTVTISNVVVGGDTRSFTYNVTVFAP